MKKTDTHAFVNQIVFGVLVTICFGGSIGLGTVWMRHRISYTARTNRDLVAQINALERNLTETKSVVDSEQSTELLRQRNLEMGLGLVPISEQQVIHVAEDPVRRLAARNNGELMKADGATGSFRVALGQ